MWYDFAYEWIHTRIHEPENDEYVWPNSSETVKCCSLCMQVGSFLGDCIWFWFVLVCGANPPSTEVGYEQHNIFHKNYRIQSVSAFGTVGI